MAVLGFVALPFSLFAQQGVSGEIQFPDSGHVSLSWGSEPGTHYEVSTTTNLTRGTWDNVTGGLIRSPGLVSKVTLPISSTAGFFRVINRNDMAYIPAGNFDMGDTSNGGMSDERPVHSVYISPFYIGKYEVTKQLWDEVYNWALDHGYDFVNPGLGKAFNHPVHSVNWYDEFKWCNAYSEKEGLVPCYTVEGNVYRTGEIDPDCNWDVVGYRLPTEAEWEKACRGGLKGLRFPWGDLITHSNANYYSKSTFFYDTSSTRGYHPLYNDGVTPFTNPIDAFEPNGYGLYDMVGNVWDACWDWYDSGYYTNSPSVNPRGPSTGINRVERGNSWLTWSVYGRSSRRAGVTPFGARDHRGLRVCLSAGDDMAYIPAGNFDMGDTSNGGMSDERPVHSVYVSAFYMGKYEVTKELWDEVYNWALEHGYSFDNPGQGKASNHPVHSVSWYDIVKWCNARSEKEGLTPSYMVDGDIYHTGQRDPDCNWNVVGYRLPTEAEWEKACRGGQSGLRFPWGDLITHSNANYYSTTNFLHDISSTLEYHPDYNDGISPYTSPVGSFEPNGYGLYDMVGNVWNMCWDWYDADYYATAPSSDPRGPAMGLNRVTRGGAWSAWSVYGRSARRGPGTPPTRIRSWVGVRVCLPADE